MDIELTATPPRHVTGGQMLERSYYYGHNLFTFLATSEETQGAFCMMKVLVRKGLEPPRHVHSREEETSFIISGEVVYEVGDQRFYAKAGDYVHLPRLIPHTFKLVSDTATMLHVITPGGLEQMFIQCGRPAESMELPPVPVTTPPKEFFEKLKRISNELGVTILPTF